MELREDHAWLLQSRVNPRGIAGALSLDRGRLRFVLAPDQDGAPLEWLEAEAGLIGVGERLAAGDEVVAFDHPLAECVVTWPITGGGSLMLIRAPRRRWVVSYDAPASGKLAGTLGVISGRHRAREWKRALARSGA